MKALCWFGSKKVEVREVPDPIIQDSKDIILKVTLTAICGSYLHLFNGCIPTMEKGDILGHEFMGIVVETGRDVKKLKKGETNFSEVIDVFLALRCFTTTLKPL